MFINVHTPIKTWKKRPKDSMRFLLLPLSLNMFTLEDRILIDRMNFLRFRSELEFKISKIYSPRAFIQSQSALHLVIGQTFPEDIYFPELELQL